jgi:hypothetical protein
MKDLSSGVSPATGLMALTRTPDGASSTAIDLVAVIIQPLEELYQLRRGRGLTPAVEATLRMAPAALLFHDRNKMAGRQVNRLAVDRDHPVEILLADVLHRRGQMSDRRHC